MALMSVMRMMINTRFISSANNESFHLFPRRGWAGGHSPAFRSAEEGGQGAGGRVAVVGRRLGGRHEVVKHLSFSLSSFNVKFLRHIIVFNVFIRVMLGGSNNSLRRSYRVIQRSSLLFSPARGTEVNTWQYFSFSNILR